MDLLWSRIKYFVQRIVVFIFSATSLFSVCGAASDDTPPQPGWRCPRGRRRISWLHQVCTYLSPQPHVVP